jgi:hypothetical protein
MVLTQHACCPFYSGLRALTLVTTLLPRPPLLLPLPLPLHLSLQPVHMISSTPPTLLG